MLKNSLLKKQEFFRKNEIQLKELTQIEHLQFIELKEPEKRLTGIFPSTKFGSN